MAYIQTLVGLVLLVGAGDILVRGSVSLASRLGVSPLIIGLTVVAFGTSAPELMVGIDAALSGAPTLALGNVVGSNIANILLVLGLPALIMPIACRDDDITLNVWVMLGATIFFILLCFLGTIGWWQGLLLATGLICFLGYSVWRARVNLYTLAEGNIKDVEGMPEQPDRLAVALGLVVAGLAGLIYGAQSLVEGSMTLARHFGVSEAVIGLTLVAIGTSLPELVTSIMAALRKHGDVAVGNVIGSNIFNLLGIMGVTSLVAPVPVPESFLNTDLWVMAGSSIILLYLVIKAGTITRWIGAGFTCIYAAYLALITLMGG